MPIIFFLLTLVSATAFAQNVRTYIPSQAEEHLPTLKHEIERLHPELPWPQYYAALIEHESCISLKHSRCWNPKSRLKTQREEGAGLSMITRTWRKDGSLRFDTLSELRQKHMSELKELSWGNIYDRPDLQIRAMLLLARANYKNLHSVEDEWERLAMADAAYNGGLGGLNNERRACGLAADCNAQKWWNNVERYCLKSKAVLYGNRSACDINRHHVNDVLNIRLDKYEPFFRISIENEPSQSLYETEEERLARLGIKVEVFEYTKDDIIEDSSHLEKDTNAKTQPEVTAEKSVLSRFLTWIRS